MPATQGIGNCQYTVVTTVGTATINQLQGAATTGAPLPGGPGAGIGVLYGANETAAGTTYAITMVDIVVSGTTTATNTLMNGTGTANQIMTPGPAGIGVRYRGALVAITSGTAGSINVLWD
jgi:N-methylhydantoinase A/oxoprolinase/acetone carboxylase beta subunit